MTLGHEMAGIVAEIGEGVTGLAVGDRVAAIAGPWDMSASHGIMIDGGFAEFATIPASQAVHLPDGVSFDVAAVATDSVATAYHALCSTGELLSGETVGVIGLGGLGLNGVQIGNLVGAAVYGVDISPATFSLATAAGARSCFTAVADLAEFSPDLIVDFAGAGSTTAAALEAVRVGGRVVAVGLAERHANIDVFTLIRGMKSLKGSWGMGSDRARAQAEFGEIVGYLASGQISPLVDIVPFEGLNAAYERLEHGDVGGRLVTHPSE
jgi:propanol-preferring alcohol dehydrogenase